MGAVDDLVGRADELAALQALLTDGAVRLVTLTGPGGIGKTRLARALADDAPAGSALCVDLAPLDDPRLVLTAVANALGLPDAGHTPVVESVAAALAGARRLLVLDNFEHVLAAADDVACLLERAPTLTVLVTSRAPLHRTGEREVRVAPLSLPAAEHLFVARARAARSSFSLTPANAAAVSEVCARLEGIPLAIELAAARIKALSAEQVAERLADCLPLLASRDDERATRHRTLQAALDWSFLMLDPAARALLRRMAVFAGGASIEALERVCAGAPLNTEDVLDNLETLIDQSLVLVDESAGQARYRVLEIVRQYALEHVRAAREEQAIRARHAAWCLALAEEAEAELRGPAQLAWLTTLAREYANLRVAVGWTLAQRVAERAQRLASALWKFCEVRGHAGEGERWLSEALALGETAAPVRSKALLGAANLAFVRGDYALAAQLHQANVDLARDTGDRHLEASGTFQLASVMRSLGETAQAEELCRSSLAIFRALDDRQWCARALNSLGMILMDRGSLSAARTALEEALALFRLLGGTRGVAIALGNLGDLDRLAGDVAHADQHLRQSLELFVRLDDPWGSSAALESLGLVACARGAGQRAAALFGAAEGQRAEAGAVLAPADVAAHEQAVVGLRVQLGAVALESAWARGRHMPRAEALVVAGQPGGTMVSADPRAPTGLCPLTPREREVAALVARGLSNQQIANELIFTRHTADKHVANALAKLGLASRAQLAVWWIGRGSFATSS